MKNLLNILLKPFSSKSNTALLVFLVAAGYFLVKEHTVHLLTAAPYLLLLACIGMHFFMHGGHGHNHSHSAQHSPNDKEDRKS